VKVYRREGAGLEFDRLAFFTDAIFAIALTLLIVEVGVPVLADGQSLGDALSDLVPEITSFFIGFAVLGGYWQAHHRFYGRLAGVDGTLIALSIPYLAFVAFLPFPTGLLGAHGDPLAIISFAGTMGAISGMEFVLYRHAWRSRLLAHEDAQDVYRWNAIASLLPVAFFALSIPIAFLNVWAAVACWFLAIPAARLLDRRRPGGVDPSLP
jgi:uncharacterized membrane protein